MKTVVLTEPRNLELTQTDPPREWRADEALVEVHRVGVCGTDLHAYCGDQPFIDYPHILGHELGVRVVHVESNDRGIRPGDCCAIEPYLNCGRCVACRRGRTNCCAELRVLGIHIDGGLRERLVVPIDKLYRSDRLTLDQLALVETLGIGAHAVARGDPQRDECVLVVGAGPIGLGVSFFATLAGAQVVVADVREDRLAVCRDFGVKGCIDGRGDVPGQFLALTGGEPPTVVFDATGSRRCMIRSFDYVAHGGTLVLVGLTQGNIHFSDPELHRRELTILATRNSTSDDFARVIGLLENGRIDASGWFTHRAAMDDIVGQFPTWLDPEAGVVKAVVDVNPS